MSRTPRVQIGNAVYYLMPAGDRDKPIFKNDGDYALYLELLAKYKKKRNFKLFAFCLTPKSINLLIEPSGDATISQIMHDLNPNYTKYFNRKYKRTGHLFQERYRMALIEKEPNLLKMTAYINLIPRFLHLTDDISNYKYSSFLEYLNEERGKTGIEIPGSAQGDKLDLSGEVTYVLGCLKDKSYEQFVNKMAAGEIEELNKILEKDKVIGSDVFQREVELRIKGEKKSPEPDALPQPILIQKPDVPPQPEAIEMPEAPSRPKSNKWIFVAAVCLTILSFAASMFYARTNIMKMQERMEQELDTVSRSYEAKLASSQAAVKGLEAEKRKAEDALRKTKDELLKTEDELSKAKSSLRLRNGALRLKKNGTQGD